MLQGRKDIFLMKDNLDKYTITVPKQIKSVVLTQIVLTLVMGFFGLFLILQTGGIISYIFGAVMVVVQVHFMYAKGYEMADYDLKSYSKTKPFLVKGFLAYIPIIVITILLNISYYIIWSDALISNGIEILLNYVYVFWTMPYFPYTVVAAGTLNILGIIASIVIPVLFLELGYILRLKNFDLSKVTDKIMYEKE